MGPTALDTLNPLPDTQIMQSGADYLSQNSIDKLLGALLENVGGQQQTGLSPDRKTALLKVFSLLDKQGEGRVQIGAFRDYISQHGTATLAPSDVEQIFRNINTSKNNMVTADDFLAYMDGATHSMDNAQFQGTVSALLQTEKGILCLEVLGHGQQTAW